MKFKSIKDVGEAMNKGIVDPDIDEMMAGVYAYGMDMVDELIKEANDQGKRLRFFYATPEDENMDLLSYKMEDDED